MAREWPSPGETGNTPEEILEQQAKDLRAKERAAQEAIKKEQK